MTRFFRLILPLVFERTISKCWKKSHSSPILLEHTGGPMMASFDRFIFLKNGYSFFKHLVPFAISALILLTLSIPADNLLLKLVKLLQKPSWVWLPAGGLAAGSASV